MTDDARLPRRALGLETRVTVLEVEMRAHLIASEQIHREHTLLIGKLDERADKSDLAFAKLLAKLSVVFSVGIAAANLLAPVVLKAFGFQP